MSCQCPGPAKGCSERPLQKKQAAVLSEKCMDSRNFCSLVSPVIDNSSKGVPVALDVVIVPPAIASIVNHFDEGRALDSLVASIYVCRPTATVLDGTTRASVVLRNLRQCRPILSRGKE
eukprot:SAG31_NODE_1491_length_8133_cov_8.084267_5_plen_119_part_00